MPVEIGSAPLTLATLRAIGFGGLPVVDDDGALVGIVTESDICRVIVEEFGE